MYAKGEGAGGEDLLSHWYCLDNPGVHIDRCICIALCGN